MSKKVNTDTIRQRENGEKLDRAFRCLLQAHKRERDILKWIEEKCEVSLWASVTSSRGEEDGIFITDGFDNFCKAFNIGAEAIRTSDAGEYRRREFTAEGVRFFTLFESEENEDLGGACDE